MPPLETMDRHQDAVLWAATGAANHYGEPLVGSPVDITVRWVNQQREMLDPQGNTVAVDATVVAAQEIPIGSVMAEGTLADWLGTGSGEEPSGRMQVKAESWALDLKGRITRREYGLMRFRDSMPVSG